MTKTTVACIHIHATQAEYTYTSTPHIMNTHTPIVTHTYTAHVTYTYTHHHAIHTLTPTYALYIPTGSKRRGKRKTPRPNSSTIVVNKRVHKYMKSSLLPDMPRRARCVACYARSITSPVSKKRKLEGGTRVPTTTRACNVCRKMLCSVCFHNLSLWTHDCLTQHQSSISIVNR